MCLLVLVWVLWCLCVGVVFCVLLGCGYWVCCWGCVVFCFVFLFVLEVVCGCSGVVGGWVLGFGVGCLLVVRVGVCWSGVGGGVIGRLCIWSLVR
ncbi:hypothetical protein, partial [Pseudomonas syringae group genomosp. 7]|uniref:hypothetical protein n=1 Tax=Pseudomonas syringae group genomosp. 7 TaxID=251699 RepID=UPI00376FA821